MRQVYKPDTLLDIENATTAFSSENLLPLTAINCGDIAEDILHKTKLKDSVIFEFRKNVHKHFIAGARHLLEKTVFVSSGILNYFKFTKSIDVTWEPQTYCEGDMSSTSKHKKELVDTVVKTDRMVAVSLLEQQSSL